MKVPKPRHLPSGNWNIQMRLNGKSISVTGASERDCIRQAELIKAEYHNGKLAAPKQTAPTLADAINSYIDRRANVLSPSTVRGYRQMQRYRFTSYHDTPIDSIDWQRMINDETPKCNAKTLKNAWALVVSAVSDATGATPPKVKLPQVVVPDLPFLEPEQIGPFLAAVNGKRVEIAALLALSSLRRSELLALTWDSIDLQRDVIHVRGASVVDERSKLVDKPTNKNQSSRRDVPILIPQLHTALETASQSVADSTEHVVTMAYNAICRSINNICRKAGLPEVGVHGLRRSFVSLGFHLDVPEEIIMQIGGWSDYATMRKHYKRLAQSDIEHSVSAVKSFFANKIANDS